MVCHDLIKMKKVIGYTEEIEKIDNENAIKKSDKSKIIIGQ